MKLTEIKIKNYRSIEEASFVLSDKNKSQTYTLIGINESGKTSFLKGISLIDGGEVVYPRDYFDPRNPIEIILTYDVSDKVNKSLIEDLDKRGVNKEVTSKIHVDRVEVGIRYEPVAGAAGISFEEYYFPKDTLPGYHLNATTPEKKPEGSEAEDLSFSKVLKIHAPSFFYDNCHYITFWKSDPKHLIGDQINLESFAANPTNVSIPLANCFLLAKADAKTEIASIKNDTALRQNLLDRLSDSVTEHIKKVWPNHPVKIKFNINNMMLEFLIEDDEVKYKTKTTGQRSDGFKQFISFLLTISAEHANSSLERSLLLLDEPETHLHPKAQEFLRDELIKITSNKLNNIVFFATHSSYMIDRDCIERCVRVEKRGNAKTKLVEIQPGISSYAEINYEVFDVTSSDYHNELYGVV